MARGARHRDAASAQSLDQPGRVTFQRRDEPRREHDGEGRAPPRASRAEEPVVVEQERVGGEGERDRQRGGAPRAAPFASSSRVTSSVPTTGIVGPLQSGWLPMVSTNGVSRNTEAP